MLFSRGELMVARRTGNRKVWQLAESFLPSWADRSLLEPTEFSRRSIQLSLRALGVGPAAHVNNHFTRRAYHQLNGTLGTLLEEGTFEPVEVWDAEGASLPGNWMVHAEDVDIRRGLERGAWQGQTVLLSPFDNLNCERRRTLRMFDFDFTIEIYAPVAKRRHGYYVLPILAGDRLLGRVDTFMDRNRN